MKMNPAIAVVGTFDSKAEEHLFLKERIEARGFRVLMVNVGTKAPSPFVPDLDLFQNDGKAKPKSRDEAIQATLDRAKSLLLDLHAKGRIAGIISAGGGTGTHLATGIMRALPLGVPKVMVSTVASRDMKHTVGTKDITMMHSVADILGINSLLGKILDKAAGAICGMVESPWRPEKEKKRVGLTMFGFITPAAEAAKRSLEALGYEVVAFHANGTGGTAMEELAEEGWFDGILDLATHELADELKQGYCKGMGSSRLEPKGIPRLVVPGGLDCAVLEFTRDSIPPEYRDRKIFFYDFRSAIRLDLEETQVPGQAACREDESRPGAGEDAGALRGLVRGGSGRRPALRSPDERRIHAGVQESGSSQDRNPRGGLSHQRRCLCPTCRRDDGPHGAGHMKRVNE